VQVSHDVADALLRTKAGHLIPTSPRCSQKITLENRNCFSILTFAPRVKSWSCCFVTRLGVQFLCARG
jgi:hypothetical protein